jgi:hypothetical protein
LTCSAGWREERARQALQTPVAHPSCRGRSISANPRTGAAAGAQDPAARPDARTLLQHEWIQYNRRTLRSSWTRTQGYRTRGGRGGAAEAHESVTSVVERMLVNAEASGDDDGSGRGALYAPDAAAGAPAAQTPLALALQRDAGGAGGAGLEAGASRGMLLPMPPASPAPGPSGASAGGAGLQPGSLVPPSRFAEAQAQGAAVASLGVAAPSPRAAAAAHASIELSTSSIPPPPGDGAAALQRRQSGTFAGPSGPPRDDGARLVGAGAAPRLIPAPPSSGGAPAAWAAGSTPPGAWSQQQQTPPGAREARSAAGAGAGGGGGGAGGSAAYSGPGPPPPGLSLSPRDRDQGPGNDWEGVLGLFLSRLQGADSGAPTPTARLAQHNSSLSAWLDEADRPAGVPGSKSRGGGGYLDSGAYQGAYDAGQQQPAPAAGGARWGGAGQQQQQQQQGGGQPYGRNLSSASLTDSVSASSTNGGGVEGGGGGGAGGVESSFQIETKRKVGATASARCGLQVHSLLVLSS